MMMLMIWRLGGGGGGRGIVFDRWDGRDWGLWGYGVGIYL